MTYEPPPGAHGPRRLTWPADGADRAIAAGSRRVRRRRAVTGAATVASVALLGTAVVALDRSADEGVTAAGGRFTRRVVHDPAACTKRQDLFPQFPADAGYCVFLDGALVVTPGVTEAYTFRLCRRTGWGSDVIAISTKPEFRAAIQAYAAGEVVYRWGRSAPHRWHDVRIGDGECVEWSFAWDGRDAAGRDVPSGRYELRAHLAQVAWDPDQKPVGLGTARREVVITVLTRER